MKNNQNNLKVQQSLNVQQINVPGIDLKQQRKQSEASNAKSRIRSSRQEKEIEEKKLEWETLCTGLQLILDDNLISKVWLADKPKQEINNFLGDFFKALKISQNFEAMELNIIAEFHAFNLIFAKQELYLDDRRSSIFLNLMWTLLMNNNEDYAVLSQHIDESQAKDSTFVQRTHQTEGDDNQLPRVQLEQLAEKDDSKATKGTKKSYSQRKSIHSDFESFRFWIRAHSLHNPPLSLGIFDQKEVEKIIKFAQNSYFNNHWLYRQCLSDKNTNDEINFILQIDEPVPIPPLAQALYMGKQLIEVEDEEQEEEEQRRLLLQLQLEQQRLEQEEAEKIKQQLAFSSEFVEDKQVTEFKKLVEQKMESIKQTYDTSYQQHQNKLEEVLLKTFDEGGKNKKK